MKKLLLIILIIFFLTKLSFNLFAQITFKGNAPNTVIIGKQFRINYVLNTNGEYGKNINLFKTDGLKILYGPINSEESSSTTFINGKFFTQKSLVFTYILVAEKEGEWIIPPATINIGGNKYQSNTLKIKSILSKQSRTFFSKNQKQSIYHPKKLINNDIFVQMYVSKTSVYANEGLLVTFKLYSRSEFEIEKIKFPEFEGFIAQEIDLPEKEQVNIENYQGSTYNTLILKQTILYPQYTGKISIGQGIYNVIFKLQNNNYQGLHNFFDNYYSDVKKTITSSPITINVKSLPPCPSLFSGAVGNYEMTSSISHNKIKVNEPVTIKITLSGNGNIKMLKNPKIIFPTSFEVYEPKININQDFTNGNRETKTIEYYAVPHYAGNFSIPCIKFNFFDLKTNTYKTLSTKKYYLHVEAEPKEKNNTQSFIINNINKKNIHFIKQDIRYIKTNNPKYQQHHYYFFGTFKYWLYYLIPSFLFIFIFIIYQIRISKNTNLALIKTKKINKFAFKTFKFDQKYLKENNKEAFFDEILKIFWNYLSDKLAIPIANLTKDNIELNLIHYKGSKKLIKKIIFIINKIEFAHYSPLENYEIIDDIYQEIIDIINQIEKFN